MGHGEHGRNNNCFNCHNENNLELLQTRDGRVVKFQDSPQLCGSCHGPTYRGLGGGRPRAHQRLLGPEPRPDHAPALRQLPQPAFPTNSRGGSPRPAPHLLHVRPVDARAAEPGH